MWAIDRFAAGAVLKIEGGGEDAGLLGVQYDGQMSRHRLGLQGVEGQAVHRGDGHDASPDGPGERAGDGDPDAQAGKASRPTETKMSVMVSAGQPWVLSMASMAGISSPA